MAVLLNLAQENAELKAMLAAMQTKLEEASKPRAITLKVTAPKLNEKTGNMEGTSGAISMYGLGRFPITLYRSQWERLFNARGQWEAFVADNLAILAHKV